MNQTRTFLILAWLMVATLLWMEWNRDKAALPEVAPSGQSAGATPAAPATDGGSGAIPAAPQGPVAPSAAAVPEPGMQAAATDAGDAAVTVTSDVLQLTLRAGNVVDAALLGYPQTRDEGSPPVKLFDSDPAGYYAAQSGWVSAASAAPNHESGFVPEGGERAYRVVEGAGEVSVPFLWRGPDGVTIRRTFTVRRGSYAIDVQDTVVNAGADPWQGFVYRQLTRVPPAVKRGMTNPESFSFSGATWYSDGEGYGRRTFGDFADDGPLNLEARESWIAMLQHHFFSAWIPEPEAETTISLHVDGPRHLIREVGPGLSVAAGQQATTSARLWVGPKLVQQINAQEVRGLDRAVDYSRFAVFAFLGEWLFWLLDKMHGLFNNWGWAIVGLVVVVKAALYPLSAAQYKSMARMRKFQPRIAQLKERYGDDRQKFQMAMMELYKKEKINPVGGCLPILLQMPIFFALYWVLLESVELRHAPWMLWIQDLTARDPYFILPVINIAVMWATQKLTPMTGMDPMQQRMMQLMPVVFGAVMIFFPAGLVLYWVTNGLLGLAQQWWFIRKYSDRPAKA
ncbi:membrane protein insertase YidC [Luteimonas sp. RD2P54]|uniref:Membrane protein insertase YidC n=1 Tax=Luteimonas endophytica TaxID=3042023 RepID=A0ABT6J708_9GAMM|nr:membrane protein insertase YidC [Luteimonas endophytica]MDH5822603.1 membrane protein insertase YidC [Luteimonas endophytica]